MSTSQQNGLRVVSKKELEQHNSPSDCWIAIKDKVYDVTNFIDQHPGRDILVQGAGMDCTVTFVSTHQPWLLESFDEKPSKYNIKIVGRWEEARMPTIDQDYLDLHQRVFQMLGRNTKSVYDVLGLAILTVLFWGSYYLMMTTSYRIAWACFNGLIAITIGFVVMHQFNHGAFPRNIIIHKWAQFVSDTIGGVNSIGYRYLHSLLHHVDTHGEGDMDVENTPFLRQKDLQDWHIWYYLQPYYGFLLYGMASFLLEVKLTFQAIFMIPRTTQQLWELLFCKAIYWYCFIVLPWQHGFFFETFIPRGIVASMVYMAVITTNHQHPYTLTGHKTSWLRHQLAVTTDVSPSSMWLHYLTGGITLHIAHHLFPSIATEHLPKVRALLENFCRERGLMMQDAHANLMDALVSHHSYLKHMADPTPSPKARERPLPKKAA